MRGIIVSITFVVNLIQLVHCAPTISDCAAVKKDMRAKAVACWKVAAQRNSVFYIPDCDDDTGAYKPEQCLYLGPTMECWCVTQEGQELPGTRVTGRTRGRCTSGLAGALSPDETGLQNRAIGNLVTKVNQCIKKSSYHYGW